MPFVILIAHNHGKASMKERKKVCIYAFVIPIMHAILITIIILILVIFITPLQSPLLHPFWIVYSKLSLLHSFSNIHLPFSNLNLCHHLFPNLPPLLPRILLLQTIVTTVFHIFSSIKPSEKPVYCHFSRLSPSDHHIHLQLLPPFPPSSVLGNLIEGALGKTI